jgi:hypothetical protein
MIAALPLRHRTAMAVGLYLVALGSGAWASTLVGDPDPTVWGVALGGLAGLALALALVIRPVAVSRSGPRGGAPARR